MFLVVSVFGFIANVNSQDTLYIYKDGVVLEKHAVAEIDSVIFYKTEPNEKNTVTDIDGNVYKTVSIGAQTWMAENLGTTTYNDGTPIPNVTGEADWRNQTVGAYCWYDNDEASYKDTCGAIYNWYTVETEKLCPAGWHVPSNGDWDMLEKFLTDNGFGYGGSGNDVAKAIAHTKGWQSSPDPGQVGNDQESNNSSGFTGLRAGQRWDMAEFSNHYVNWWTATDKQDIAYPSAYTRVLMYNQSQIISSDVYKEYGLSVRCIKD